LKDYTPKLIPAFFQALNLIKRIESQYLYLLLLDPFLNLIKRIESVAGGPWIIMLILYESHKENWKYRFTWIPCPFAFYWESHKENWKWRTLSILVPLSALILNLIKRIERIPDVMLKMLYEVIESHKENWKSNSYNDWPSNSKLVI